MYNIIIPEFTVTPYIDSFDVHFRTVNRINYVMDMWSDDYNGHFSLPAYRTDECDCRLCTIDKLTGHDSDRDIEVYLPQYQPDEGYGKVARFKKSHPSFIEDLLCADFQYDEFFIKQIKYVFDFESKKQGYLEELITESIELKINSTEFENVHVYVETCKTTESEEPIIRLNVVANYPNQMGTGVVIGTGSMATNIIKCISFCTFDQGAFLKALTEKCMHFTNFQMSSLVKQLQDASNMNDLRKITSRYVDSKCLILHPLQVLFKQGVLAKDFGYDPPSYDNKTIILNTEPDIIPELEYYLPEYR